APRTRIAKRTPETAQKILKQKAPHACSGINGCKNEQSLKHDREVVPKRERSGASRDPCKHVRHTDGKSRRPARAIEHGGLAEVRSEMGHLLFCHRKAGRAYSRDYFSWGPLRINC